MKAITWLLLLGGLFGCRRGSDIDIEPKLLLGTWNGKSAQLFSHWTFDSDYLYAVQDSSFSCQPVESHPSEYRIEKDVLIIRYIGITNGLIPSVPLRYPIISLTEKKLILSIANQQLELERCD